MKTSRKRVLSALLTLAMLCSLLTVPAAAAAGDMTGAVGDKWVFVADDEDTEVTEGWDTTYQFDSMTGPMKFKGLQLLAARSGYHKGYLYPEKGVGIPVAGKCQVEVTCTSANGTLSVGDNDENAVKLETNGTAVYSYASETAGTVTLKQSSYTCVTKIKITAYSDKPTMKLNKDSVVVKMGGTAEVTPTITHGTADAYAFVYATDGIVTATATDGKITITPVAAGKTTVTVKATVGDETLTADIAVRVLPAEAGKVTESTTYNFLPQTEAGQDTFYSPGLAWSAGMVQGGTDHGVAGSGGTLTVYIPDGKQADLVVRTCQHGSGSPVTATAGGKSAAVTEEANSDDAKDTGGKKVTLAGATGTVVFTFTGTIYVHSLEVGAFSDAPVVDPGDEPTIPADCVQAGAINFVSLAGSTPTTEGEGTNDAAGPVPTITGMTVSANCRLQTANVSHGLTTGKTESGTVALKLGAKATVTVVACMYGDKITGTTAAGAAVDKPAAWAVGPDKEYCFEDVPAGEFVLSLDAGAYIHSISVDYSTTHTPAMKLSDTSVGLKMGETETAAVTALTRFTDAAVEAVSKDTGVATVSVTGKTVAVQAVAKGVTTVEVTVAGTGLKETFQVVVKAAGKTFVKDGTYNFNPSNAAWAQLENEAVNGLIDGMTFTGFTAGSNQSHGIKIGASASIQMALADKASITVKGCQFGAGANLVATCYAVGDADKTPLGTITGTKGIAIDSDNNGNTMTWTMENVPAGDVVVELTAPGGDWIHGIEVHYSTEIQAGTRNIQVWDFGGVAETGDYDNQITTAKYVELHKALGDEGKELFQQSPADAKYANTLAAGPFTFGTLNMMCDKNDRLYLSDNSNAELTALLGSYAGSTVYDHTFDDGYAAKGAWYCNGAGSASKRYLEIGQVQAGDTIKIYADSSSGTVTYHLDGPAGSSQQTAAFDRTIGDLDVYVLVAEQTGTYKLWSEKGKPVYYRVVLIPAIGVTGTLDFSGAPGFSATGYKVKFTNKTTKQATYATLDGNDYSVSLAPGYEYTAMLTGTPGFGITRATKTVAPTLAQLKTGIQNKTLAVGPKTTYDYTGKVTGFAAGYDTSHLAITLTPSEESGSDTVELELAADLSYTAKLDPGSEYALTLAGVNDYQIKTPAVIVNEEDKAEDITVELKPTYAVSGKFTGLGADGKVTALTFTNVDDGYTYVATVSDSGYSATLRDGAYSTAATVQGSYSTITHVVVGGKAVEKDLLFAFAGTKPAVTKVKDVYVGYAGKANNYDTVSAAVDAISRMGIASEADRVTVHIAPGTYREQVIINTPYVTFINDEPDKGEVLLTWYYGIGYKYYSAGTPGEGGYYNAQRAYDKYEKNIADRWGCSVRVLGKAFRAENITFENSFNRYMTEEEILDGVESTHTTIEVERNYGTDVTTKAATERAAAICVEADECEFFNCQFLSSQDTVYTQGKIYFKSCKLEGMTDYIFGDFASKCIFDGCELSWKGYKGSDQCGYITAVRTNADDVGYLFRNCTVTANSKLTVGASNWGRPWSAKASAKFINTKLEKAGLITAAGWVQMDTNAPQNAQFGEYNTTSLDGTAVDTSKRVSGTVMTQAQAEAQTMDKYFGSWVPYYYVAEDATVAFVTDPTITDNGDINTPYPGHTLSVNYSLGEKNDANDASAIQWIRVADSGAETVVKSTTASVSKTYQLTKADIGATIKVTVTPTTVSGKTGAAKSIALENKVRDGFEDPTGQTDPELGDGVNVFLVGDSTVCEYNNRNEGSWGEALQYYLDSEKVTVVDHAVGGRSSRSFINEGRLATVAQNIKEGDFLLIQFGHNDCSNEDSYRVERYAPLGTPDANGKYPTTAGVKDGDGKYTWDCGGTYKWYLQQYIDVAKAAGATPILVTPVARLYYTSNGTIRPHHDASLVPGTEETTKTANSNKSNTYCDAVKQLAQENGIQCIDAFQLTKDLYEDAYKACQAGDKTTYGRQVMFSGDSTHSNKLGGMIQAALVAQTIRDMGVSISKTVKAPAMAMAKTTAGQTVFTVNADGKLSAYDQLQDYAEHATYWEGVGQKLIDALKSAAPSDPDEPVQPGDDVDTTALTQAIAAAKAAQEDVAAIDAEPSGVLDGQKFVSRAVMDALDAAIAKAEAAQPANAAAVAAAVAELNAAVETFQAAIQVGTSAGAVMRPTGGSGSGAGAATAGGSSTTVKNDDGSVTNTVTKPDGTVTTTVTTPDGGKSVITEKPDGSMEAVITDAQGVKTEAETTATGETSATVTLPAGVAQAVVSVPKKNIDPGMVAVIVNDDGTEEIVKLSVLDADGLKLLVKDSVNVKLVDNSKRFDDVPGNHWARNAVDFASSREIFKGTSEKTFAPTETVNRAMMATVLYRLESTGAEGKSAFADVAEGAWYSDAVAWANQSGVVTGFTDGTFGPDQEITREQMATMLYRYAKTVGLDTSAKADVSGYPDASSVSDWAGEAMAWAVSVGLITGTSDPVNGIQLSPAKTASRAEAAIVMERMVKLIVQ